MRFNYKKNNNGQLQKIIFLFVLFSVLTEHFVHGYAKNCKPLPQCCKTFVFSPACRGAAAKRRENNENLFREPRAHLIEINYETDDYGNSVDDKIISDQVSRNLNNLLISPSSSD